jgi:GT2 family glycosyltransferase
VIQRIGYLKDEYFAYWEDTEYSIRAIRAGYENVVCKSAKVFHKHQPHEANQLKKGQHYYYFMQRNRIFLEKEYLGKSVNSLAFKIRCLAITSEYARRCGKENIDACMNGTWHGIKGKSGPMSNAVGMPNYFRRLLLFMSRYHPILFAELVTFDIRSISRKALARLRSKMH